MNIKLIIKSNLTSFLYNNFSRENTYFSEKPSCLIERKKSTEIISQFDKKNLFDKQTFSYFFN